jgi:hypothetical protein
MNKRGLNIASLFIAGVTLSMCTDNSLEPPEGLECTTEVSFAVQVAPIIQGNCAINGCHNGTQFPALTSYNSIKEHATLIRTQVITGRMPLNGELTNEEISSIVCWIDSGAPNN